MGALERVKVRNLELLSVLFQFSLVNSPVIHKKNLSGITHQRGLDFYYVTKELFFPSFLSE